MPESAESGNKPRGLLDSIVHHSTEVVSPAEKVYVYEAPLRIWHWINALCIVTLCITGYLIGKPLPSVPGEASFSYAFGYVRLIHFAAGQIIAVALIYRIFWAIFGNHHAHQLFLPPFWSGKWWAEVIHELRWYAFMEKTPKKYIGHNPLAQVAMFFFFLLPLLNGVFTGMALYAEGAGTDSWWFAAFGWVFAVYGDSFSVHTIHRINMWVIVWFAMIHIYVAFREDIMSRQSLLSTMASGWRYFKDDKE